MTDKLVGTERATGTGRHYLEFETSESKRLNPIPAVGAPWFDDNRKPTVPHNIDEYLKRRYGPDVKVNVGNSNGNPDGSGYSYRVFEDDRIIAEMQATKANIKTLPLNYEGWLREEVDNLTRSNGNGPGVLEKTLWRIHETPEAEKRLEAELQNLKASQV